MDSSQGCDLAPFVGDLSQSEELSLVIFNVSYKVFSIGTLNTNDIFCKKSSTALCARGVSRELERLSLLEKKITMRRQR